tara:strand:+ start:1268 stop:1543 length:276 start_codon:yes stop_codon:yes gene_type:complete
MGFLPRKEKQVVPKLIPIVNKDVIPAIEEPKVEQDIPEQEQTVDKEGKEEKSRWIVVKELPTQVIRESVSEDGTTLHFITIEEALTQFANQ